MNNPFANLNLGDRSRALLEGNRHWLYFLLAAILVFGGGFATGRWASPPQTITTEKVHEVVKTQVVVQTKTEIQKVFIHDSQKEEKIHRVIAETTKADGEKTKTTTEDIGVDTVIHDNSHDTEVKYVDRVVEKMVDRIVEKTKITLKQPDWRVGAGVGIGIPYFLGQGSPGVPGMVGTVVDLELDRRVVGPFWLGVKANTQGVLGLQLSAVF